MLTELQTLAPEADIVGFNGFAARVLCLTHPSVVETRTKDRNPNGKARWTGITCDTTYEVSSGGPFVHRRVIFKCSTAGWNCDNVHTRLNPDAAGGIGKFEYLRRPTSRISNPKTLSCLHRMFGDTTVRGCLENPVNGIGITVLRDEKHHMTGKEDGVRLLKKYWNSFKTEPTMQYTLQQDGSYGFALTNSPQSQHIYIADFLSYGLGGLNLSLPDQKISMEGVQSGQSGGSFSTQRPAKRSKSDNSVMSEDSGGGFATADMKAALDPMSEDFSNGFVSVSTRTLLYFDVPK